MNEDDHSQPFANNALLFFLILEVLDLLFDCLLNFSF